MDWVYYGCDPHLMTKCVMMEIVQNTVQQYHNLRNLYQNQISNND